MAEKHHSEGTPSIRIMKQPLNQLKNYINKTTLQLRNWKKINI